MRIVQVAAEFAPIAKAGGLGEVILGLSRELTARHHQVDIILPKYSQIDPNSLQNLSKELHFQTRHGERLVSNSVWSAKSNDCNLHLIEPHDETGYFQHSQIYGYPDDVVRFLYFSRAVMDYLQAKDQPIDVLHLHDWHVAACAPLLRDHFPQLKIKGVLFTIHNLEYQGKCATWDLDAIGMQGSSYLMPDKMKDFNPHLPQAINLLKGGIHYSDAVNTVSPTYAREVLHKEMGFGLNDPLKKAKILGILNGIDQKTWNPAADPHLSACYGPSDSLLKIQDAKRANKEYLQKRFGLKSCNLPLVAAITRLVPQKGLHLLQGSIEKVLEQGGAFALLGSSPIAVIQQQFDELRQKYKNNPFVFLEYHYSEPLAHQIYAAADFILVPSLFEPCGLTQLIAMRYGSIPIVRATGGLKDTVFDCEDGKVPLEKRNGFVFSEPTVNTQGLTLRRALHLWHKEQPTHLAMIRRVMQIDSSWKTPASEYLKLYTKLSGKPLLKKSGTNPIALF